MKATLYGLAKTKNDIQIKSQLEKMLTEVNAEGAVVIDGANLAAGSIYGKSIVAGTIDAEHIKTGSITADHITAAGITADKIKTGSLRSTNNVSWLNLNDGTFSFANGNFTFSNGKMIVKANTIELGGSPVPTKAQSEADAKAKADEAERLAKLHAEKEIEKIQVGGRNYVLDSMKERRLDRSYGLTNLEISKDKLSLNGAQVTVSFEAKHDAGNEPITPHVYYRSSSGTYLGFSYGKRQTTTTEFKKFEIPIEPSMIPDDLTDYPNIAIRNGRIDDKWNIKNIKLEKGNKSTDWTPAPEDVELVENKKIYNPVRYIRDWSNGSSANTNNHWFEIVANDTTGVNLALGKIAKINGVGNNLPVATDGQTTGAYATSAVGKHYIQVDLGETHYNVSEVAVWRYNLDARTYFETKTEVSEDGINWYPIFDSLIEGEYSESPDGRSFANTKAKSESLLSAYNTTQQLASATSKVVINGGNITAGSIQDANRRNKINLDNGTFSLANGNIVYNGSILEIKSGVSFSALDSTAKTGINNGNASKTLTDKWSFSGKTTINGGQIEADTIKAAQIAANTITANQIAAGTITANEIKSRTITADRILANAITANEIAAGTITATEIKSRTITADRIATNAITANEISVANLSALSANLGRVTAGTIASENGLIDINLNTGTINLGQPLTIKFKPVATKEDIDNIQIGGRNLLKGSASLKVGNLKATPNSNSRAEYSYVNIGDSFKDLKAGENVTISFDIETTNLGVNSLSVYNNNRLGARGFTNVYINKIPAGKSRQNVVVSIVERESPQYPDDYVEFYSTYGTNHFYEISNIKLEKGSKATDWTPAPEDVELAISESQKASEAVAVAKANLAETNAKSHADGVLDKEEKARIAQAKANLDTAIAEAKKKADEAERLAKLHADTKVDSLEIGGRNLYIKSKAVDGFINAGGTVSSPDMFNKASDFIPIESGRNYTFSLRTEDKSITPWARCAWYNSSKALISVFAYTLNNYNYSITEQAPAGAAYARVSARYLVNDESKLKFEIGNKATDWSPAPEDIETDIKNVKSIADKSVKSSDVEYYLSTSATALSGGGWQTTAPTWVNGRYMWSRTKTTLNDNTVSYSPNATGTCIAGAKGDTGGTGASGKGVTSITEEYAISTSKATAPTSGWTTANIEWKPNHYIWSRSKIVYNNPTSTVYTTPISDSAWEAVDGIQIGGRNLIIRNQEEVGKMVNLDGSIQPFSASSLMKGWIPVQSGEVLAFSQTRATGNTDGYFRFAYFRRQEISTNSLVKRKAINEDKFFETVPSEALWLKVSYNTSSIVKIERGNIATDWTPAPEDVDLAITESQKSAEAIAIAKANLAEVNAKAHADGKVTAEEEARIAQAKANLNSAIAEAKKKADEAERLAKAYADKQVGDIQVGGRNYLSDSKELKVAGSTAGGLSRRINEEGHLEVIASVGNGNYVSGLGVALVEPNDIKDGDLVTFSIKMKSSNATGLPTLYLGSGMGYLQFDGKVTKDFSTIQHTREWNLGASGFSPHFGFSGISGTFVFSQAKLEKGNKATDWTPAPEDVDSAIDSKSDKDITDGLEQSLGELNDVVANIGIEALKRQLEEYQNTLSGVEKDSENAKHQLEQILSAENGELAKIKTILDDLNQRWETQEGFIEINGSQTALAISKGNVSMVIDSKALTFFSGGEPVATITNQYMRIDRGIFVESMHIGRHQWSPLASNRDHFTLNYVGEPPKTV